ncbi:DUF6285 domain-containing protein [Thalassobaculum litoreum]|uniref:DUF6285 domain-containing protein n=1 Tax=Thalassobaculum litoreum DSM 18839 TaxID=1123362 RepID=A0A8G2BH35_9PROT|nr:DUF6285 domain-containing protein [Thalassobaculum litoreum]SDF18758.1 hypothetical protein SAMN05660686_00630 [Thalassobaculum litoreum DSM 18839]
MSDRPNKGELLAAAEETLRDEVLPALEGSAKYAALMVAAAIATARREIETGHDAARRTLDAYAELYGHDNVHRSGGTADERINALSRDLAHEIRAGTYDADLLGPVFGVLETQVVERLGLSNPRFLTSSGYSQPGAE